MVACLMAAIVCCTSAAVPVAAVPPNQVSNMFLKPSTTLPSASLALVFAACAVVLAAAAVLRTPVMALNRLVMKLSLLPGLVPPWLPCRMASKALRIHVPASLGSESGLPVMISKKSPRTGMSSTLSCRLVMAD
ncbi:Uncharacterised protein [Mycobacteroides abscessus subsp. abscessus]|nr:Uncharacterised protein [Mycobacteroides abscessus subsp. abscessus]